MTDVLVECIATSAEHSCPAHERVRLARWTTKQDPRPSRTVAKSSSNPAVDLAPGSPFQFFFPGFFPRGVALARILVEQILKTLVLPLGIAANVGIIIFRDMPQSELSEKAS